LWPELIDARLSPEGKKDCVKKRHLANQLDIKVVLVSPLRRGVETAYEIFREHPNFDIIEFVLVPEVKEMLMVAGDLPDDIDTTIETYGPLFPRGLDFTLIQRYHHPRLWYAYELGEAGRNEVLHEVERFNGLVEQHTRRNFTEVEEKLAEIGLASSLMFAEKPLMHKEPLMDLLEKHNPGNDYDKSRGLEPMRDVRDRVRRFKENIVTKYAESDHQVAIVSHSVFAGVLTSDWTSADSGFGEEASGLGLPNDHIYLYNTQFHGVDNYLDL